ncbi:hypothetical protein A4A49_35045 [Nicotiana attenuata]|uniref:Uncharacterized protein n=1 Tax=Nicotiana attenuata TaxID=49451 RepID=A0A1J6JIY7_NICAT|nr:hypothetical protein A4A49_35045 [Nicotiana attenuata]
MKILSSTSLKKIQMLKWWRRWNSLAHIPDNSVITLVNVGRRARMNGFQAPCIIRKSVLRFKSQWRQALGWRRNSMCFSYDAYSYSRNFDDGCFKEHPSPLVP